MRDDAVLRHALPLGRGLGRRLVQTIGISYLSKSTSSLHSEFFTQVKVKVIRKNYLSKSTK